MVLTFTRFDLASLWAQRARLLSPVLFVVAVTLLLPLPELAALAAFAVTTLFAATPFIADERSQLDTLYATLPITRRTVVLGRYLLLLLGFVAVDLLGTGLAALGTLVRGDAVSTATLAEVQPVAFLATSVALGVQLPLFFALGYARARPMTFVPAVVLLGPLYLAYRLGWLDNLALPDLSSPLVMSTAAVGGLAVLALSAAASARLYARREL